jgi:Rieske Fe-S protein
MMMDHDRKETDVGPDGRPLARQPAWRRDFPHDWQEDHYVARRDFTKFLVLTSLAFVVGQFWILVQNWWRQHRGQPPIRRIVAAHEVPVGGVRPFHYPGAEDHCLLFRLGEEQWVAYDQQCTHLSCAVTPELAAGRLHCPCHHAYFDLATGRPLAGPPRRPLERITLLIQDGAVYATGVERRTV